MASSSDEGESSTPSSPNYTQLSGYQTGSPTHALVKAEYEGSPGCSSDSVCSPDANGSAGAAALQNGFNTSMLDDMGKVALGEGAEQSGNPRLCAVCSDLASGYHYGIASCEACKAFFKRTVQGNLRYQCHSKNKCEVNKKRRKACPACRFQKCIDMGMMIDGVRPDRVRGGRQKYRRRPEETDFAPSSSARRAKYRKAAELTKHLLKIEPPVSTLGPIDPSLKDKDPAFQAMKIITDLGDRALVNVVQWAKQVPGFTELSLSDRRILLQDGWMEILLWQVIFRSIPLTDPDRIAFTKGLSMDEEQAARSGLGFLVAKALHLVRKLRDIGIDKEEYALLKAIILCNVELSRVEENTHLGQMQNNLYDALHHHIMKDYPGDSRRVCHLLSALPTLRQLSSESVDHVSKNSAEKSIPIQQLFREMLESNTQCD
ncbi:steroid hormone receptor ERR1-like [Diadema setosum]|uniref:steroid hormone receptor ERR1-like n=1 Tax=Diadema setosum TaxID=31175 RepID=UPI003B3ABE52